MKTETVNNEKWELWEDYNNEGEPVYSIRTKRGDETILTTLHAFKSYKENCELIVSAVNACKEINKDNPLKVALGLPQLFKRLDDVMNDKRLDWGLYGELAAIVDTLKSNF